jgi:hypothetical protein
MDVTLAFISLRDEKVGHVPPNTILVRDCVSTKDLLETRAI